MNILLVAPFPGPPMHGGNLPVVNMLKRLPPELKVHLAYYTEPRQRTLHGKDILSDQGIRVESCHHLGISHPIRNRDRLRGMFGGLFRGLPPGPRFMSDQCGRTARKWVGELVGAGKIDILHVWGYNLGPCMSELFAGPRLWTIGDCFSFIHETFAKSGPFSRRIYHSLVSQRHKHVESFVGPLYDRVVLFARRDQQEFSRHSAARTLIISLGVDTEVYAPRDRPSNPVPVFCFHGYLDYLPNRQAVDLLINQIGPGLSRHLGQHGFVLRIIGRASRRDFFCRGNGIPWLEFTGYVKDIHSALGSADVYLSPVQSGAGVKNKVLEAMAMGLPIIGTKDSFAALDITPGLHAYVCTVRGFVPRALALVNDANRRKELGTHARRFMVERYSWHRMACAYIDLYSDLLRSHSRPSEG